MTGSRNYINLGNGLQMSLARNKTSANRLKIILDEDTDTYTMYFYRQTLTKYADIKVKEIAKYEGVYAPADFHGCNGTLHPTLGRGGESRPTFFR